MRALPLAANRTYSVPDPLQSQRLLALAKLRRLSFVLMVLGVLGGILLIGWFGWGGVVSALTSVGWQGLGLVCAWQLVIFAIVGLAWDRIVPPSGRSIVLFVWGRMVRDAAANCLPFSQVGGFVLGARAVTLQGVSWSVATASTMVDITAEFLAQIFYASMCLLILLARVPHSPLAGPVAIGIGVALAAGLIFFWMQRRAAHVFARLAARIADQMLGDSSERAVVLQTELKLISGHTGRVALCVGLHLLGWFASGFAGWLGFRLVGAGIDVPAALAIEGLLQAAMAVTFLVPGNVGVQEATYVGLGAAFGVSSDLTLAVSLLRRARDLAVGVPILVIWQIMEARRLRVPSRS